MGDKVTWKPIKDYPTYEISTTGEVRSFLQNKEGRILRKANNQRNQQIVSLTKEGKKAKTVVVSRLVATTFLEKPLGKNVVCHKDNNPFNNNVTNLRWDTHLGNELDRIKNKTTNHGDTNGNAKLSEKDVLQIHKMRMEGITNTDIAGFYDINPKTVSAILNFRMWKYLKETINPKEGHILVKKKPHLLSGGTFVDDRGVLKFVNGFDFIGIKRFYLVHNATTRTIKAWHGHYQEDKVFFVTKGAFLVGAVDLKTNNLEKYVLSEYGDPKILWIPHGYANGFMNLTEENSLIIFSTATLEESLDDDERFPYDKWDIWKETPR